MGVVIETRQGAILKILMALGRLDVKTNGRNCTCCGLSCQWREGLEMASIGDKIENLNLSLASAFVDRKWE